MLAAILAICCTAVTITVSPEHHVLVATSYSASEYPPFRGFLNVGDIHSCEPWLYSECLQRNIKVRAKEWRKIHGLIYAYYHLDGSTIFSTS